MWYFTGACFVISLVLQFVTGTYFKRLVYMNISLHAVIEAAGALLAFVISYALLSSRKLKRGPTHSDRRAYALTGMGVLDVFHAISDIGNTFVWLHSIAVFTGGVFFSMALLPEFLYAKFRKGWPLISLILVFGVVTFSLTKPQHIPAMLINKEFSPEAILLNVGGGILFYLGAIYYGYAWRQTRKVDDIFFILFCLLIGTSAVMFQQSSVWDISWWAWHFLKIIAYSSILWFVFLSQNNLITDLTEAKTKLETFNVELEEGIKMRTQELYQKNLEITNSINYAQKIQTALFPNKKHLPDELQDSFFIYKPKDTVSGDFYIYAKKNGHTIVAVVDCTGHGVPGAFLSIIAHNLLNEIILVRDIIKPADILRELNNRLRETLRQDENDTKDGMDIAVVVIAPEATHLQYAGANRPLYIFRNKHTDLMDSDMISFSAHYKLQEIKANKCAIGGFTPHDQSFDNHILSINKGDTFYLFSDGYADQFGGKQGKKLMTRQFKELILHVQSSGMNGQEKLLNEFFENWKGMYEQVDDVLVIGVRV
jgi:serine phosphatase RsbU (regulator of sigma subunit)